MKRRQITLSERGKVRIALMSPNKATIANTARSD